MLACSVQVLLSASPRHLPEHYTHRIRRHLQVLGCSFLDPQSSAQCRLFLSLEGCIVDPAWEYIQPSLQKWGMGCRFLPTIPRSREAS